VAAPGLSEIATTTLRNRSGSTPSSSRRNNAMPIGPTKTKADKKRVMHTEMHKFKEGKLHSGSPNGPAVTNPKQAIAIGLSESGQSRNRKPKGGGYDRSGHFPGNPGFKREGKPPYGEFNGGARAKQPSGKSVGNAPEFTKHKANQSYASEQAEHGGRTQYGGDSTMKKRPQMAYGDSSKGKDHSSLREVGGALGPERQDDGKSAGAGSSKSRVGEGMGGMPSKFDRPPAQGAQGFGHGAHLRRGPLRMSGHPGAHRVGGR
jgi:hypothetical protein